MQRVATSEAQTAYTVYTDYTSIYKVCQVMYHKYFFIKAIIIFYVMAARSKGPDLRAPGQKLDNCQKYDIIVVCA